MRGMRGVKRLKEKRKKIKEKKMTPQTNLDYRRDVRSLTEFEKQIRERTLKEKFLSEIILREWKFRGYNAEIFDNGVDNSGELITDQTAPFRRPDYKAVLDNTEFLFDIKNSGIYYKATFVADRLRHYVSVGAFVLLFLNTGFIDGNHRLMKWKDCRWALIRPKYIEKILSDCSLENGGIKWGFKPVVILKSDRYHKYFDLHALTYIK